jgi:SPP1 family predicted phage head-tail adaptor
MTSELTRLRERVTLQTPATTSLAGGEAGIDWQPVADVFAAITATSGRSVVTADGTSARVTHELVVRWRSAIKPAMRFLWNGQVLRIHAVLDRDGRRRWLTCHCEQELP